MIKMGEKTKVLTSNAGWFLWNYMYDTDNEGFPLTISVL